LLMIYSFTLWIIATKSMVSDDETYLHRTATAVAVLVCIVLFNVILYVVHRYQLESFIQNECSLQVSS